MVTVQWEDEVQTPPEEGGVVRRKQQLTEQELFDAQQLIHSEVLPGRGDNQLSDVDQEVFTGIKCCRARALHSPPFHWGVENGE